MKKFNIPKKPVPPSRTEPRSLIIYSKSKAGKSSIVAQLPDSLIIEHELGGVDALTARSIYIDNPNDLPELLLQIKNDPSIKVIIIDTITRWDEYSEIVGTYSYMQKPQGKNWNVIDGKRINHLDPRFDSVHALGQGFGYRYSRETMVKWFNAAMSTNKTVIFLAHIKDKLIESKSGDTVETSDLSLTGKVKSIYVSKVDAIANLKRVGDESFLVFENLGDTIAGSRYSYLKGEILIGKSTNGENLKTYWSEIFPSLFK